MQINRKALKKFGFDRAFDSNGNFDPNAYREAYIQALSSIYKNDIKMNPRKSSSKAFSQAVEELDRQSGELLESVCREFNGNKQIKYNAYMGGMTPIDVKNVYREGLTADRAIAHAVGRVKDADGIHSDLTASRARVSALRELINVHNTRSIWWKLRHPILNSREKQAISSISELINSKHNSFQEEFNTTLEEATDVFDIDSKDKFASSIVKLFNKKLDQFEENINREGVSEYAEKQIEEEKNAIASSKADIKKSYNEISKRRSAMRKAFERADRKRGMEYSYMLALTDETDVKDRAQDDFVNLRADLENAIPTIISDDSLSNNQSREEINGERERITVSEADRNQNDLPRSSVVSFKSSDKNLII